MFKSNLLAPYGRQDFRNPPISIGGIWDANGCSFCRLSGNDPPIAIGGIHEITQYLSLTEY